MCDEMRFFDPKHAFGKRDAPAHVSVLGVLRCWYPVMYFQYRSCDVGTAAYSGIVCFPCSFSPSIKANYDWLMFNACNDDVGTEIKRSNSLPNIQILIGWKFYKFGMLQSGNAHDVSFDNGGLLGSGNSSQIL